MTKEKGSEVEIQQAHLWSRIKAQVLDICPLLSKDEDGHSIVQCPRCENWAREEEYTVLGIMPKARQWCCAIRKCGNCGHLSAICE